MKRGFILWLVLGAVFVGAIALVVGNPNPKELPYSSLSTSPQGTKAAYLLLEELGFQVQRKTTKNWDQDGVLLALGSDYLPHTENAVVLDQDYRFTNQSIRDNAEEFVQLMWPYRDQVIVFEEYGRRMSILSSEPGQSVSLSAITPAWLQILLTNLLAALLLCMAFYRQRLGDPVPPEGFSRRKPLEGVQAFAGALWKAKAYKDCAGYYYAFLTRSGNFWDKDRQLEQSLEHITTEQEALALVNTMDQRVKENKK